MSASVVRIASVPTDASQHPASSPFDRRLNGPLGLSRFGLYEVALPAGATTVPHDHRDDGDEDAYVVVRGSGLLVVDGVGSELRAGDAAGVPPEHERWFRAGPEGATLIAVCA
ncbi:MAG: cupin domain-containing protein [Curtobacterium sp.]